MHRKHWICCCLLVTVVYACNKEGIRESAFKGFELPEGFPAPAYRVADNMVTEAGFVLGRKLFYEPRLSRNNTVSCGSCHIQSSAFTQHGHDVSHGIDDRLGIRNSPPIMNLAWSPTFMWDGGVFDLDLQPVAPITNHEEMDETIENVLVKLRAHPDYPAMFGKAFGSDEITNARMMKALSQFMIMCVSSHSRYDSVMRGEGGTAFTPQEQAGYNLVQQKCAGCHKEPLFTDYSFRNNGLAASAVNDLGRYTITLQETDKYRFKVPSLRNLAYTAPYMHDGRLRTIDAVLDHYTSGVQHTPNLDPLLRQNGVTGIALTENEKAAIVAFLNTLNDKKFITDPRLSEQ